MYAPVEDFLTPAGQFERIAGPELMPMKKEDFRVAFNADELASVLRIADPCKTRNVIKRTATVGGRAHVAECPCGCDLENFSIAKHALECTTAPHVVNYLGGEGVVPSPIIPSTSGWPGFPTNDAATWPNLMVTMEHITAILRGTEWELLAKHVRVPQDVNSKFVLVRYNYMPSLANVIPMHALPNSVESQIERRQMTIRYNGISCELDASFLQTTIGFQHGLMTMQQMARGLVNADMLNIARQAVAGGLTNLLTIPNRTPNKRRLQDVDDLMAEYFAMFNRAERNAFQNLERYLSDQIKDQDGAWDEQQVMIVMPHSSVTGLSRLNTENVDFHWAGQAGPQQFGLSQHIGRVKVFGRDVLAMYPMRMPPNTNVDPLESIVERGEYEWMFDTTPAGQKYNRFRRDIQKFTANDYEEVTLAQAISRMQIWKNDGSLLPWIGPKARLDQRFCYPYRIKDGKVEGYANLMEALDYEDTLSPGTKDNFLAEFNIAAKDISDLTSKMPPDAVWYTKSAIVSTNPSTILSSLAYHRESFLWLNNMNLPVPLGILLLTPHKTYTVQSTLAIVASKALVSYAAPISMVIVDQGNLKRFISCYMRMGAGIIEPRNIAMALGTFVTRYHGGDTVDPMDPQYYFPKVRQVVGSTIYAPVPWGWRSVPKTLCLLPSMIPNLRDIYADEEKNFLDSHGYPSVQTMDNIFGFNRIGCGRIDNRADEREYGRLAYPINVFCRRASFLCRDESGTYTYLVEGDGYWGTAATYPGASRIRGRPKVFHADPPRGKFVHFSGR